MGGFFKGVGKGLVGAVVKPVVGVTDSVISVAQVWTTVCVNFVAGERYRRLFECCAALSVAFLLSLVLFCRVR